MRYAELPIEYVFPNPSQPRKSIRNIDQLADSIEELGLIQPIVVKQISPKKYIIQSGERRWTACKKLGWKTISAKIDDKPCAEKMLAENLSRDEMCLIEKINGIAAVLEKKCGSDWKKEVGQVFMGHACKNTAKIKKFCKSIGLAPTTVYLYLPVLKLPKTVQERILENIEYFTDGVIRKLASLKEEKNQLQITTNIVFNKMTSSQAMKEIYMSSFKNTGASGKWYYYLESWKISYRSIKSKLSQITLNNRSLPRDEGEQKKFLRQVSEIKNLCTEILKQNKKNNRRRSKRLT